MATFEKLSSGVVQYTDDDGTVHGFSGSSSVIASANNDDDFFVTDNPSQHAYPSFVVDSRKITVPSSTDRNDLIGQLALNYFSSGGSGGTPTPTPSTETTIFQNEDLTAGPIESLSFTWDNSPFKIDTLGDGAANGEAKLLVGNDQGDFTEVLNGSLDINPVLQTETFEGLPIGTPLKIRIDGTAGNCLYVIVRQ